jgi:hypothetical protein
LIKLCIEFLFQQGQNLKKQKNTMKKLMIITALFLVCISLANAQTPVINKKQANQQSRIRQGVRSGELTPQEAQRIKHQEQEIRKEERVYKADGVVTPAERRDLNQDLNHESKVIEKQKHDKQKMPRTRRN